MEFHELLQNDGDVILRCRDGKKSLGCAPIELTKDCILPDAYADIKRILSVSTSITPTSAYAEEGKVFYRGELTARVLFVTDEGEIGAVPFTLEYDGSMPAGDEEGDYHILCMPTVEGSYARLVNPRKIGIKAKVSLGLYVWEERDGNVFYPENLTADDIDSFEEKTEEIGYCTWCHQSTYGIESGDDIMFEAPDAPIKEILYTTIDFCDVTSEAREGAVAVNGKADVTVVYIKDGEEAPALAFRRHTVELASLVELDGVSEKDLTFAALYPEKITCVAAEDAAGERRIAELDFSYCVTVAVKQERTYRGVKDLYSTKYECENEEAELWLSSFAGKEKAVCRLMGETSFKEEGEVIGGVFEVRGLTLLKQDAAVRLDGTLHASVIIREEDGSLVSQPVDIPVTNEVDFSLEGEYEALFYPTIEKAKITLREGKLSIEVPVTVHLAAWENRKERVIAKTRVIAENDTAKAGSFTVYFPEAGEGVWEIAKKYRVPRSSLVLTGSEKGKGREVRRALIIPQKKKTLFKGVVS